MKVLEPILVSFVLLCFMSGVISRPRQKNQHHGLKNVDDRVIAFTDNVWDESIPKYQKLGSAKTTLYKPVVPSSVEISVPKKDAIKTVSLDKSLSEEKSFSDENQDEYSDESWNEDSEQDYSDENSSEESQEDYSEENSYEKSEEDYDGEDDDETMKKIDDDSASHKNENSESVESDESKSDDVEEGYNEKLVKIASADDDDDDNDDDDISDEKKKLVEQYIKEIYGGELPYGDDPNALKNDENMLKDDDKKLMKKKKENKSYGSKSDSDDKKKLSSSKKENKNFNKDFKDKKSYGKKGVKKQGLKKIDENDNKNKDFIDKKMGVKGNNKKGFKLNSKPLYQYEEDKKTNLGKSLSQAEKDKQLGKAQTQAKPLSQFEKDKKKKSERPLTQLEKDKMNMFKTPYEVNTSPNPPTTKPTKVTPVDHRSYKKPNLKQYIQSKPQISCSSDDECPSGRTCYGGICMCGNEGFCDGHNKPVCGSNGVLYDSHCELHRLACIAGKRIKVDHTESCLKKEVTVKPATTTVAPSRRRHGFNNKIRVGNCEYEPIIESVQSTSYLVCDSFTTTERNFEKCRATCDKCTAFKFDEDSGRCEVFTDEGCIEMLLHQRIDHYLRQCSLDDEDEENCGYMRVEPGTSSDMCGTASSNTQTIERCHLACRRSFCQAFKYDLEDKSCNLYLDRSCIPMLQETKSNYFVRRCTTSNDEQCDYGQIDSESGEPCERVSSSTRTFEECRDACETNCLGFSYQSNSGACSLFSNPSCFANQTVNYYNRKCPVGGSSQWVHARVKKNKQKLKKDTNDKKFKFKLKDDKKDKAAWEDDKKDKKFKLKDDKKDKSAWKDDKKDKAWKDDKKDKAWKDDKKDKAWTDDKKDKAWKDDKKDKRFKFKLKDDKKDKSAWKDSEKDKRFKLKDDKKDKLLSDDKNQHINKEDSKKTYKDPDMKFEDDPPGYKNKKYYYDKTHKNDAMMADDPGIWSNGNSDDLSHNCNTDEFDRFKGSLIRYHCVKFGLKDCDLSVIPDSGYLISLMFSYYDRNTDNYVEKSELFEIQSKEKFTEMFETCHLLDLFKFDKTNDDVVTRDQFIKAFDITIEEKVTVIPTLATVGNGLEIQCALSATPGSEIIWRRHGIDLMEISFPDIAVFSDGILYFDNIGIHHIGNYTCHDRDKPGIKQVHALKVQMPPLVRLSPSSQMLKYDHTDIVLHCHAEGIPPPAIIWEVNKKIIPNQMGHYVRTHENGTLIIHDADYQQDTGAYKCLAKNTAGEAEDLATVFIRKPNESTSGYRQITIEESFFIFHKNGYNVYDPKSCATQRLVKPEFGNLRYIPEELDSAPRMCPQDKLCSWGNAVTVKDRYIYIAQPEQDRVMVIDSAQTMNPVQFVSTDKYPTKIHYVEHLDQIWVLCWNSEQNTGSKTIIVIRDASKDKRHHMVHTQPIGYRFDLVQDIFLPPSNDLKHKFNYGYVIHNGQRGLFKLELDTMRYTKAVDLSVFDCVPEYVAYVPMGGQIVVKCIQRRQYGPKTIQILMDHVTDVPLANVTMPGTPYVTPDSRHIATVDERTGKVRVSTVLESGAIEKDFEVTTGSSISDVSFIPSDLSRGYDLVLSSAEDGNVFTISLTNGKVTVVKALADPRVEKAYPWSLTTRSITSGNYFSEFFASPSASSFTIINGKHKTAQCNYVDLDTPEASAFSHAVSG